MCTLAIYFRVFDNWPVVIGANRDEFLARPALPPMRLADRPEVVGGKDVVAGGTWLGINEHGVFAGLLNRRADTPLDPALRSRGLLCLDALACGSVAAAAEFVRGQRARDYNPFNLLVAGREQAFLGRNRAGQIDLLRLEPGLHLVTNLDLDDPSDPRVRFVLENLSPADFLASAGGICRDERIIIPGGARGTVSSSLILAGSEIVLYHVLGDPRGRDYAEYRLPDGP